MGPSGCGKSSTGLALWVETGWPFIDGDDHHPEGNKIKQATGKPLTDKDRAHWIDSIVTHINAMTSRTIILANSALTAYVQNRLINELHGQCHFFMLNVSPDVLKSRVLARKNHFMPASLLQNQLETLSPPDTAIWINTNQTTAQICTEITAQLKNKT